MISRTFELLDILAEIETEIDGLENTFSREYTNDADMRLEVLEVQLEGIEAELKRELARLDGALDA
jgi:hypothetical protein